MNILDEILKELKAIRAIVDPKPKIQKKAVVCPTLIIVHDKLITGQLTDGLSVRAKKTLTTLQNRGVKNLSELTEDAVCSVWGRGTTTACELAYWAMEKGAKP